MQPSVLRLSRGDPENHAIDARRMPICTRSACPRRVPFFAATRDAGMDGDVRESTTAAAAVEEEEKEEACERESLSACGGYGVNDCLAQREFADKFRQA